MEGQHVPVEDLILSITVFPEKVTQTSVQEPLREDLEGGPERGVVADYRPVLSAILWAMIPINLFE